MPESETRGAPRTEVRGGTGEAGEAVLSPEGRMRQVARTAVSVVAAASMVAASLLVTASPASAATPRCNSTMQIGVLRVPAYKSTHSTVFCVLPVGSAGAAVRQLQTTLNICYGQRLQVDGSYGWKTFNAVAAAQRAERMSDVDGVYGPDTAMSIKHQNIYKSGASWCGYQ